MLLISKKQWAIEEMFDKWGMFPHYSRESWKDAYNNLNDYTPIHYRISRAIGLTYGLGITGTNITNDIVRRIIVWVNDIVLETHLDEE